MQATQSISTNEIRKQYFRTLWLSIALSVFVELLNFLVISVYLYPAGSIVNKFIWTVVFCGLGIGVTVGTLINWIVIGRWQGVRAVFATTGISVSVIGIACEMLCLNLDQTSHYLEGAENPTLLLGNGILMAGIGGIIVGTLLFTETGQKTLARYDL